MTAAAPLHGMLLIDKPRGMTSHDVVQVVRRKLGIRRIGHTGTLDPMAQGLLILLVGSATKSQHALQGHEKVYEATLCLGIQTDTGDAMGRTIRTAPVAPLERGRVEAVLGSFQGPLSQTPPAYSAIKVQGRPAYWWTRRQQPVTLSARTVHLFDVALIGCEEQAITFRVRCSAGTYVRTLAESIAERLGTVGHLAGLTRLSVGAWRLEEAKPLSWVAGADPAHVADALRPVDVPAHASR
ncbi:MAG: tRNA pseudouridine(55) synthase TruB [Candidatus Omnitrophica bacterium]|nr:tRNA pseudouridine(55) synthase TruB [Candidatus Omnitrophota bacterium]